MTYKEYLKAMQYISEHYEDEPWPDGFLDLLSEVDEYQDMGRFPQD